MFRRRASHPRKLRRRATPRPSHTCGRRLTLEALEDRRVLAVSFQFDALPGTPANVIQGFKDAGKLWESFIGDTVTVVVSIGAQSLGGSILGQTSNNKQDFTYAQVRAALLADVTSVDDVIATSNLAPGPALNVFMNHTADNPNGAGSATPYVDNDGGANNLVLSVPRANARGLGLIAANDPGADGTILFDTTNFAFDFDRTDGITAGQTDFVFVASHEIGHLLGFESGVDRVDFNDGQSGRPGPFNDDLFRAQPLDLFRTSLTSEVNGADLDLTADTRIKDFTIDGGTFSLGTFSTGVNNGDGNQASHWKNQTPSIGIMDPNAASGEFGVVTGLDLTAFDVIGWNLALDDRLEANNTIGSATNLGSEPEITLQDLTISNGDDDFFKYTANRTGKLIVNALFKDASGDIDMTVLDKNGNIVAFSTSTDDDETIIIPVVAQQSYFIHVFGFPAFAVNEYTLEIENIAAPAPTGVDLDPASDTGASSTDNITGDTTPTFLIQTDVLEFIDTNGNGTADAGEIAALTAAQAAAANAAGVAVEVTMVNTTTAQSFTGFADPIIASVPEVYRFTPAVALPAGVYIVSARLKVFDPLQNPPGTSTPFTGRTTASPLLAVTINLAAADTIGPQITGVTVNNLSSAQYDVFDPKPTINGPTPLVTSLRIGVQDFPNRIDLPGTANDFLDPALNATVAMATGNYMLVGDHVGVVAIQSVAVINNVPVNGAPATATIVLNFAAPLPDDRYTLKVSDHLVDPAGNHLDGEANITFPSGDTVPGGDFVTRFTVDSRPEIASYIAQQINVDINGNFVWDPANSQIGNDASNVDITFTMGVATGPTSTVAPGGFGVHDLVFAGKFFIPPTNDQIVQLRRFDQLAVYGNAQDLNSFRWLIDRNSDGVVNPTLGDILTLQPQGGLPGNFNVASAIPVAGNFDLNALNGDEIGLYNAGRWALDTNRNFIIDAADTFITDNLLGHPIVGDFDGDGTDDLAVFNNNTFSFDLRNNGFGGVDQTLIWGFPGVLDRPVAADMDQDGIDDIGLWVPRNNAQNPLAEAEWYFLVSNDRIITEQPVKRVAGTIVTLNHPFTPVPFGHDLYAEFGNELALPLVGNFDPPAAHSAPATLASNGDFDGDGDVDGGDLLAWQRSSAQSSPTLGQWKSSFSQTTTIAAAATQNVVTSGGAQTQVVGGTLAALPPTTIIQSTTLQSTASAAPTFTPSATVSTAAPASANQTAAIDAAFSQSYSRSRSIRSMTSAKTVATSSSSSTRNPPLTLEQRDDAVFATAVTPRHRTVRMRR